MTYDIIKGENLSPSSILALSLKLFYEKKFYILGILTVFYIPFNVMLYLTPADFLDKITDTNFMLKSADSIIYYRYSIILIILHILFTPLVLGALSFITAQTINNKPLVFIEIVSYTIDKWLKLSLTYGLYFLIVCVSFIFMVIPGIFLGIALMLSTYVAALSNKYGFSALKISYSLLKGQWLNGLLLFLLSSILSNLVKVSLTGIFVLIGMTSNQVLSAISSAVLGIFTCFPYIAMCMFYFNRQVNYAKKEEKI